MSDTSRLVRVVDKMIDECRRKHEIREVAISLLEKIKDKLQNPFSLSESQKKLICDYYHCSDSNDKQYPSCEYRHTTFIGCGLKKTERLLEILIEEEL